MDMLALNLQFAWVWIAAGVVSGVILGLGFHREDWLGGYGSWRRRMLRLGHIAFFGTAFVNIAFALTAAHFALEGALIRACGVLLIAGAAAMPLVCFASAWRKPLRHLFVIPVVALLAGSALFAWLIIAPESLSTIATPGG